MDKQKQQTNKNEINSSSPKNKPSGLENYARYTSVAIQMGVIIAAGVYGGTKLDEWIKWEVPVFTVVLSLLSVAVAIYLVIKDLIKKK